MARKCFGFIEGGQASSSSSSSSSAAAAAGEEGEEEGEEAKPLPYDGGALRVMVEDGVKAVAKRAEDVRKGAEKPLDLLVIDVNSRDLRLAFELSLSLYLSASLSL